MQFRCHGCWIGLQLNSGRQADRRRDHTCLQRAHQMTSNGRTGQLDAYVALAAPLVFISLVLVQAWQSPGYSHVSLPISALAAWPSGWIQNLNFLILAAGMLAFAVLMHRSVAGSPAGVVGPMLLAFCGAGLVLAAAFPWVRLEEGFAVPRGHVVGAGITFAGAGAGFTILSRRMSGDPEWASLAPYTLITGAGILGLFIATFLGARSDGAPFRQWLGLLQRLTLLLWLPCVTALSWRALRGVRHEAAGWP